jgi:hypothetical protein
MARKKLQRETEHYGVGQSGYTAGRLEGDPALGIDARNISYPKGADDRILERGDDERWIGAGGKPWVPQEREWLSEVPEDDIDAAPEPDDPKREPDPEREHAQVQPD